jgi:hypothetical protein
MLGIKVVRGKNVPDDQIPQLCSKPSFVNLRVAGKTPALQMNEQVGPFLADGKNNDVSIAKNIFINNEQDVLN